MMRNPRPQATCSHQLPSSTQRFPTPNLACAYQPSCYPCRRPNLFSGPHTSILGEASGKASRLTAPHSVPMARVRTKCDQIGSLADRAGVVMTACVPIGQWGHQRLQNAGVSLRSNWAFPSSPSLGSSPKIVQCEITAMALWWNWVSSNLVKAANRKSKKWDSWGFEHTLCLGFSSSMLRCMDPWRDSWVQITCLSH
jgi:hypothetical protein